MNHDKLFNATYQNTDSHLSNNSITTIIDKHSTIQNRINNLIVRYNESIQTLQMKYETLLNHINKLKEYIHTSSLIEEDNNVILSNKLSHIINEFLSEMNTQQTNMKSQLNYISTHFKQSLISLIKEHNDIYSYENNILSNILNTTNDNINSIKHNISSIKKQNEIKYLSSLNKHLKQTFKHLYKKTNDDYYQMELIVNKDKEQLDQIKKYVNNKEQIENKERLNINNTINAFLKQTKNYFDKYEF